MPLQVRDVAKRFRRLQVLRGASFHAGKAELVGLVGENGSGKSTLLQIVAGMLRKDGGEVAIDGSRGYCPQQPLIFDGLTVEQNVLYFTAAYGLDRRTGLARGQALMERLDCRRHAARPAGELSGGVRQKVNLILALLHRPDVLLLDEPYQGLDLESYREFWELARELRDRGASVVIVSHLFHDRDDFARVYRLEDGRTVAC